MVKQRSGKIINISSVVGFSGNPGQVNYSSTKSALVGFTKSLAREVGTRGVTVNAVAPGYISTELLADTPEKVMEGILAQIPIGRLGTVDEVSRIVTFLASDDAGFITGSTISANGGQYFS